MYTPKELKSTLRSNAGGKALPAININKKALLKDTFPVPLKKKSTLSPLPPKINNFFSPHYPAAKLFSPEQFAARLIERYSRQVMVL